MALRHGTSRKQERKNVPAQDRKSSSKHKTMERRRLPVPMSPS